MLFSWHANLKKNVVNKFFFTKASEIFEHVRMKFIEILRESSWLKEPSVKAAVQKVKQSARKIKFKLLNLIPV